MPLDMEVGLSAGDFVLDGDRAPSPKGGGAPDFQPMSIAAKRLDASKYHLIWRKASSQATQPPSQKGGGAPSFRPMSIVAKRLHGSRCHLVRRYASYQTTLC